MPPEGGKSDMERIGVFKEMRYISIGDKYTPFIQRPCNESAQKGKQILTGGATKKKSGLQVGYFDTHFKRVFEKEALTDPVRLARQYRSQQSKKNVGSAFLPSNGEKKPYPNVTLSKVVPYSSDPYDRANEMLKKETVSHKAMLKGGAFHLNLHPKECFDNNPYKLDKPLPPLKRLEEKKRFVVPFKPSSPNKTIGGMKAGTFDIYPTHSADLYITRRSKSVTVNKEGKVFHPSPGPKSTPVKSIISVNVNRAVHSANYTMNIPSVMAY
ncbi:cilia-and flagella-associated protein 96 isoform 2-T3 [Salvelinus alpinus]